MRIRMMLMDYYYGLPPVVEDFLRWQRLNLDHSDKTVDEYALDLRTFLRFMKRERGAVSPDTPFDEIDISDVSLPFINGITRIDVMNYIEYLRLERVSYEGTPHEKVLTSYPKHSLRRPETRLPEIVLRLLGDQT